jgi:hypothetical protein
MKIESQTGFLATSPSPMMMSSGPQRSHTHREYNRTFHHLDYIPALGQVVLPAHGKRPNLTVTLRIIGAGGHGGHP